MKEVPKKDEAEVSGGAATGLVIPGYPTLPPYNPSGPFIPTTECPTPVVDTTSSTK